MGKCLNCGKEILDDELYCEDCKNQSDSLNDDVDLDALLSSIDTGDKTQENIGQDGGIDDDIMDLLNEVSEEKEHEDPAINGVGDLLSDALSNVSSLDDQEMMDLEEKTRKVFTPEVEMAVEESKEAVKEKKPSFFKRIFGNVVDDKSAKMMLEEAEAESKKEEQEKKKAEELAKKKEAKEQAKKEKDEKKAEAKKAKEEKKAQKAKEKEEQKAKEAEEEKVDQGRINPLGAALVGMIGLVLFTIVWFGSGAFMRKVEISRAEEYADRGLYEEAYQSISGLNLSSGNQKLQNKLKTIMLVRKQLNSYLNYKEIGKPYEALDALIHGVEQYYAYASDAKEYEVQDEFNSNYQSILSALAKTYNISEDKAKEIAAIKDSNEYSQAIYNYSKNVNEELK